MATVEEVKEAWTMEMVLDLVEIEYTPGPAAGFKIHSIFNEENTPSMHIYEDHWYDYSSGKGGDVISFVREYMGCSFGAAMRYLEKGVGDPMEWQRPAVAAKEITRVNLYDRLTGESNSITGRARGWLTDRVKGKWGLTLEDLHDWGWRVGSGDSLWIPHYHGHDAATGLPMVTGIHVRDLRADKKFSVKGSWFTAGLYHRVQHLHMAVEPWLVVEGEPDAVAVWKGRQMFMEGLEILALPTGAGTIRREWFDRLKGRQGYVCFDNDTAGRKATAVIRAFVPDIIEIPLPKQDHINDCADAHREGWVLTRRNHALHWSK